MVNIQPGCDIGEGWLHKGTLDDMRGEMHYRGKDNTKRVAEALRPQIAQYLHSTSPTPGPSPARTFQAGAPPGHPRRAQAHSGRTAGRRGPGMCLSHWPRSSLARGGGKRLGDRGEVT